MKILTLSNCKLVDTLGSGKTRLRWSDGLRNHGHEVDVICTDELKKLFKVPLGNRLDRALNSLTLKTWSKYDLVEIFGAEFGPLQKRIMRHRDRPVVVAHADGIEPHQTAMMPAQTKQPLKQKLTKPLHDWIDHAGFKYCDVIVSGCKADVDYAKSRGWHQDRVVTNVDLGVDDEYLAAPIPTSRKKQVVFFGSWTPRKALDRMCRVMTRVLTNSVDANLIVLGAGSVADSVYAEFPDNLHSRIQVMPRISVSEIINIYAESSCLFLPSHYEGYGLVTVEAMACACPVVTTQTGIGWELKDEEEAFIRDFIDEEGMVGAIQRLLNEPLLVKKIGEGGRTRVQGQTWERQISRLANLYDNIHKAWDRKSAAFRSIPNIDGNTQS